MPKMDINIEQPPQPSLPGGNYNRKQIWGARVGLGLLASSLILLPLWGLSLIPVHHTHMWPFGLVHNVAQGIAIVGGFYIVGGLLSLLLLIIGVYTIFWVFYALSRISAQLPYKPWGEW
jgi:hypothetical protein